MEFENIEKILISSTTAKVTVQILDINEPPICSDFEYVNRNLTENVDLVGTVVGYMNCSDGDAGNQALNYFIEDSFEFFKINKTGAIIVNTLLDRESKSNRNFINVRVTDNGIPAESIKISIPIRIIDQPDEQPVFIGNDNLHACHRNEIIPSSNFTGTGLACRP